MADMRNLGLISKSLNDLSNRIERQGARKMQDELALGDLGLKRAQVQQNIAAQQGQQEFNVAKQKREQWLNEPVTIGQAIDTHPNWDDQTKANIKASIGGKNQDSILNYPTTRLKLNEALGQLRKEATEASRFNQQIGIERGKLNVMKQKEAKDNRSNMQKEVEFIAQTMGVTPQKALKKYQKDKTLGERIRLYNNELDRLAKDNKFKYALTEDQQAQKIKELRDAYKISDITDAGNPSPQDEDNQLALPENITKASEAMSYLKEQGLTEEQAKDWLRDYMSK